MRKLSMLFCMLSMAALMYGCGSSSKEGSSSAALSTVATVGDTACNQCHSASIDALTGEAIVTQYQKSAHYQAGQGCESCHGGGAQHFGVGPIPYPTPDATRCATCHDGTTAVATNSTEYINSNHALLDLHYSATSTSPLCLRCHSHEGAVLFNQRGITGGYPFLTAQTTTNQLTLDRDGTKFQAINCQTCHEHGGTLRAQYTQVSTTDSTRVAWDPNKNYKVDQFDLCTSCHTYLSNDGVTVVSTGNATNTTAPTTEAHYHYNRWNRMIATTHYDNPATGTTAAGTTIEGYVIRTKGANPCFDCHGHEAKTSTGSTTESTIYTDWAKSAHAGGILTAKETVAAGYTTAQRTDQTNAVMAAGATDATGIAWTHYNWDDTASRGACQRCHTSTGAANFMTNPATYDSTGNGNSFTHLSGWTTTSKTSAQQEVLYCWGCHTNAATGSLRTPGALTFTYTNGATATYPDVSGSNVCMSCHTGRETGDSIKLDPDADGNRSFINSHYLTAGGTLFGTTGYEYAGRDYTNPSYFKHDKIGSSSAVGTGSNGPCVGCHMSTPNSHKYTNVTKDSAGTITAITSTACATCHTGNYALTAQILVDEEHEYMQTLDAAKAVLASKGMHFYNAHPYFYTAAYVAGGTNTAFTNWAGVYGLALWKDTMGAAFNINLLIHDPGGYAHNRIYSKRLIWDAIDFIYDGVLDNDVTEAIDAQVTAGRITAAEATAAKTYLGTTRP